jgi:hypothetical protein
VTTKGRDTLSTPTTKKVAKRGDNTAKAAETRQRVLVYFVKHKKNGALGLGKRWEWRERRQV